MRGRVMSRNMSAMKTISCIATGDIGPFSDTEAVYAYLIDTL